MAERFHSSKRDELLSSYIDNRLSPKERREMEQHLAACARCREDLHALRQTVELLQALPAVRVPRSFFLPRSEVRPVWSGLFWLRAATAVVAATFLLVVSADALGRVGGLGMAPASAPAPLAQVREKGAMLAERSSAGAYSTQATAGVESAPASGETEAATVADAKPAEAEAEKSVEKPREPEVPAATEGIAAVTGKRAEKAASPGVPPATPAAAPLAATPAPTSVAAEALALTASPAEPPAARAVLGAGTPATPPPAAELEAAQSGAGVAEPTAPASADSAAALGAEENRGGSPDTGTLPAGPDSGRPAGGSEVAAADYGQEQPGRTTILWLVEIILLGAALALGVATVLVGRTGRLRRRT